MQETPRAYDSPALPSVRGIVLGSDRNGAAVDGAALRAWLRLNAEKYHALKVDFSARSNDSAPVMALLDEARCLGIRLSLRTAFPCDAAALPAMRDAGLLDVLYESHALDLAPLQGWVEACKACALPLRVQMPICALNMPVPNSVLDQLAQANIVSLVLHDPIVREQSLTRALAESCLTNAFGCAKSLQARGVDVRLVGLPFCHVPEALWACVANGPQQLASPQCYIPEALAMAARLAPLPRHRMHQAIEIALNEGVSFHNLVDHTVLPWILEKPRWFFWLWFLHKLTRRMPLRRRQPAPLPEGVEALEAALAAHEATQRRNLGPVCTNCRLHRICDHVTEPFRCAFPGKMPQAVEGEVLCDPLAFRDGATGWLDDVDAARRILPDHVDALAREANLIVSEDAKAREIPSESYDIEDHATHHMPASVRWFSFSTGALRSTVLARVEAPVTLSVTFGGGFADQIGFCFGRHTRILTSMTAGAHRLTLHIDAQGHYVLLRDGHIVNPTAFQGDVPPPPRLGTVLAPRLCVVNVDGQIVTQTVQVWERLPQAEARSARHSVVIVCTRFSRRLAAVLQALAHTDGLEEGALEVIVGYVPGIDATDDVIESVRLLHPALRILRVPFGADKVRSKGFMINECTALATGDWVTLLDADILLPPDYFVRLDALPAEASFAAPDGRHMLSAEATARILLGEIRPWDDYNTLQKTAEAYRHQESDGVPPGFCQSARRAVFEEVRYEELDHFEGSDWWFSKRVLEKFGPETRLTGLGVVHLEHGGSQWYGTGKQR